MNKQLLRVSRDLKLPLDLVTRKQAILANTGAGKSYLASVEAEEFLKQRQQIIVLDPNGSWWGLRAKIKGGKSYPVVIFGGEHADVPLELESGAAIAQAIVDGGFSAILDLTNIQPADQYRFIAPFLDALYHVNRKPIHLFIDEADDVAPQSMDTIGSSMMVNSVECIVKRGRRRGIGCTLITQRPQDLAKRVLTQCEVLVAMRMFHPLDIKTIKAWVNVQADPALAEEMTNSLPSLPTGKAWFWAPILGIHKCVQVRQRLTYDSGKTPKVGAVRKQVKLTKINMDGLGKAVKDAAEKAKENNPKDLKGQIAKLKTDLAAALKAKAPVAKPAAIFRVGEVDKLLGAVANLRRAVQPIVTVADKIEASMKRSSAGSARVAGGPVQQFNMKFESGLLPAPLAPALSSEKLPAACWKILGALARANGPIEKAKLAILTVYSRDGGAFCGALKENEDRGWIARQGLLIGLTEAGKTAWDAVASAWSDKIPADAQALLREWNAALDNECERQVLALCWKDYPASQQIEAICDAIERGPVPVRKAVRKLKALGLLTGDTPSVCRVSETLYSI